ncbi:MAG TPA: glycoside hydrolase family 3 C-terminal domain-containing protein [Pyrinomonadaceae bacterium]|nr:glycoside hydrolase family 3 C-terminal domain-containing protein [Pyrinomonadaceae bacterium]
MKIMRLVSIRLLIFVIVANFGLTFIFAQKSNLQMEQKIENLLKQLTLEEKVSLIAGTGFDTVPILRLGIPSLKMTDGPVGVRQAPATSFPSSIALAASFDTELIKKVAQAIAQETKAKGKNVLLGPCVNIQRTPFGGRNFESFGEDPYLAAQMAVAYIKGIQSENVVPSVKHFAANNQEIDRMTIDVRVDERTLNEIYFPAFKASVKDGKVWSVMAAYNKLNGFYASENNYLLTEVLKKRWNFQGLVMSDWGAVHSTVPTLQNGLDLEMPTGSFLNPEAVKKALATKEISELQITEMVRRLLRVMFWAGLMDEKSPDKGSIDTPEHRQIALEAARGGIVLLQNQKNILPIETNKIRSIAVIGPNADVARIGGGGSAQVIPFYSVSPLEGIKKAVGDKVKINFSPGIVALEDTKPIPTTNLTTPDGKSNGLKGEYFANMNFEGAPAFTRVDSQLDFHWGTNSPAENYPSDLFSNRWTGYLTASVSGRYAISLSSNDGGRLFLDDKLIVDVWGDHATLAGATAVELKAGERHKIRVEHYENRGNADLVLGWRLLENDILQKAAETAAKSDVAIIFAGLSDAVEVEARDRTDLNLPKEQEELIEAVAKANPKTIVVMTSGASVLMDKWIGKVPAVLQAFYYGQEGGNAIADVLLGKVSPSGKLPATFLKRWEDSNAFGRYPGDGKSVDYSEGILVGYRWFDTKNIEPLFPFGHGLSYTNFKYSGLKLIKGKDANLTAQFEIENTGKFDAAEVPQIYVQDVNSSLPRPLKELKGFQKVFLKAGEKKSVSITLNQNAFAFYEPNKKNWIAEKGDFKILVGSSSRDIRLTGDFRLAKTTILN